VIRADLTPSPDPTADAAGIVAAPIRPSPQAKRPAANPLPVQPFSAPAAPSWARASGRIGQGDPLFFAGASLALLDSFLHREPPFAGALRQRLALNSAAAAVKLLRLNADAAALRDLRFAIGDAGPAARLLQFWRELASRPPSLDARRLAIATGLLDLPVVNADALAESLLEESRAGDPVSAAAKAAAAAFAAFPDAPAAEAEILALWAFDLALAIRLGWPRPAPLIATRVLDPSIRSDGGRRAQPGDPTWLKAAAAAIALAAAFALDLAADLVRRAEILLAVAPKLRAKPAQRIVDLAAVG
jgi:Protein of unknown function (DUF1403)